MSIYFPEPNDLQSWTHYDLNYVYELEDKDWKCMEQVAEKHHDDYELFAVGLKMAAIMARQPRMTAEVILYERKASSAAARSIYIVAAKMRPDYRLDPRFFDVTTIEKEAIDALKAPGRYQLARFLIGAKIVHPEKIGNNETFLDAWQRGTGLDWDTEFYVDLGWRIVERRRVHSYRSDKDSSYPKHMFKTRSTKEEGHVPSSHEVGHVNKANAARPEGSCWVYERTMYVSKHHSVPWVYKAGGPLVALVDEDGHIEKRLTVKIIGNTDLVRLKGEIGCYTARFRSDLHDLIRWMDNGSGEGRHMPEPYLWTIFRAQVEALHAMQYGTVIQHDTHPDHMCIPRPDWVPVVNPDIKLANVVLGDARSDHHPAYKTAKMIDFGQAFEEGLGKYDSWETKVPVGTEGFWPPSDHRAVQGGSTPDPISDNNEEKYWLPHDFDKCYSHFLLKTVLRCLRTTCEERPKLDALLHATATGLKQWEKVHGSANSENIPEFMRFDVFPKEEFPLGAKAPETNSWPKKRKATDTARGPSELIDPAMEGMIGGALPLKKATCFPSERSKTLAASSPFQDETESDKGKRGWEIEESEEEKGKFEIKSLRNKKAVHLRQGTAGKNLEPSKAEKAQLVKREMAEKNLHLERLGGDSSIEIAVAKPGKA